MEWLPFSVVEFNQEKTLRVFRWHCQLAVCNEILCNSETPVLIFPPVFNVPVIAKMMLCTNFKIPGTIFI